MIEGIKVIVRLLQKELELAEAWEFWILDCPFLSKLSSEERTEMWKWIERKPKSPRPPDASEEIYFVLRRSAK